MIPTNPEPQPKDIREARLTDPNYVPCPAKCAAGTWCEQCHGNGTVLKGSIDETCVHRFKFSRNLGRCYNQYRCEGCGKTYNIDSSD